MRRKKDLSNETTESGRREPPSKQSKSRLIKKQKETSRSPEVTLEVTNHDTEESIRRSSLPAQDVKALIRSRAYELYERRGAYHGQDIEDWVAAERQILSEEL